LQILSQGSEAALRFKELFQVKEEQPAFAQRLEVLKVLQAREQPGSLEVKGVAGWEKWQPVFQAGERASRL
jgi:hypothetical protein